MTPHSPSHFEEETPARPRRLLQRTSCPPAGSGDAPNCLAAEKAGRGEKIKTFGSIETANPVPSCWQSPIRAKFASDETPHEKEMPDALLPFLGSKTPFWLTTRPLKKVTPLEKGALRPRGTDQASGPGARLRGDTGCGLTSC